MRVIDRISDYSGKIFSYLVVVVAILIGIEVIARYLLNNPTLWTHESAILINGVYLVMGGAYVYVYDGHVRMDAILRRLSPRKQATVEVIVAIPFFFLFIGIIVWQSSLSAWVFTMRQQTTGSTFDAPIWPNRWGLVVASGLLLLQGLAKFIRDLHVVITGRSL